MGDIYRLRGKGFRLVSAREIFHKRDFEGSVHGVFQSCRHAVHGGRRPSSWPLSGARRCWRISAGQHTPDGASQDNSIGLPIAARPADEGQKGTRRFGFRSELTGTGPGQGTLTAGLMRRGTVQPATTWCRPAHRPTATPKGRPPIRRCPRFDRGRRSSRWPARKRCGVRRARAPPSWRSVSAVKRQLEHQLMLPRPFPPILDVVRERLLVGVEIEGGDAPASSKATMTCIAMVDLPLPPLMFPTTRIRGAECAPYDRAIDMRIPLLSDPWPGSDECPAVVHPSAAFDGNPDQCVRNPG